MNAEKRIYGAFFALAFVGLFIWLWLNRVLYGVRLRVSDTVMFWFWLYAMTRMYRVGRGLEPFPHLRAWLDAPTKDKEKPGDPEEETEADTETEEETKTEKDENLDDIDENLDNLL